MARHKLALIGRNIAHSKSPEIYSKLLENNVDYHLLDYPSVDQIPSLDYFSKNFEGISITSPYKEVFINDVELVGKAKELKAINCLSFKDGRVLGCNTDYLAIETILQDLFDQNSIGNVVILGDGVMSRVAQAALSTLKINTIILSRKRTPSFATINLTDYLNQDSLLVINTCSRDYSYTGLVTNKMIFWDFNYNFKPHLDNISSKCVYHDGMRMLELQAEYALQFWSIKKKI